MYRMLPQRGKGTSTLSTSPYRERGETATGSQRREGGARGEGKVLGRVLHSFLHGRRRCSCST